MKENLFSRSHSRIVSQFPATVGARRLAFLSNEGRTYTTRIKNFMTLIKSIQIAVIAAVLTSPFAFRTATAQSTAFTYQGRLNDGTNPANGTYDLQFGIFDSLSGGTQQGNTITNAA